MTAPRVLALIFSVATSLFVVSPARSQPPSTPGDQQPAAAAQTPRAIVISCVSKIGERQQCPSDTSRGVVLARSGHVPQGEALVAFTAAQHVFLALVLLATERRLWRNTLLEGVPTAVLLILVFS